VGASEVAGLRLGSVYQGGRSWHIGKRRDDQDCTRLICEEHVGKAENVIVPADRTWYGAGSGWGAYGTTLARRLGRSFEGYDGEA
jgi:hypothetical protein